MSVGEEKHMATPLLIMATQTNNFDFKLTKAMITITRKNFIFAVFINNSK